MSTFLIAPDKFKGTLSAYEVANTIAEVINQLTKADCIISPLADGGEGTSDILTKVNDGTFRKVNVKDPHFRPIATTYGISGDGTTAYIEMAAASGMALLRKEEQDPLKTTTFGTGELIKDAINQEVKSIILGVGGSATNDAGIGMAAALGYRFLDKQGNPIKPIGENLRFIQDIDDSSTTFPGDVQVTLAADVTNPLYGSDGAAAVYAPQKGADYKEVQLLEKGLENFAEVVRKVFGKNIADIPGGGAAGGLGAGAVTFLNANIVSGFNLVFEQLQIDQKLDNTDIIITGEGSFDEQSMHGKVVGELLKKAERFHKPVLLICGHIDIKKIPEIIHDYIGLTDLAYQEEAVSNAAKYLKKAAEIIWKRNADMFSNTDV